jgi:hypothetical protein
VKFPARDDVNPLSKRTVPTETVVVATYDVPDTFVMVKPDTVPL